MPSPLRTAPRARATTRAGREFVPDPLTDLPASVDDLAAAVVRTAVREYLTGHRADTDNRTATPAERAAYQQALYEHYTTVRAYIRAKETHAQP